MAPKQEVDVSPIEPRSDKETNINATPITNSDSHAPSLANGKIIEVIAKRVNKIMKDIKEKGADKNVREMNAKVFKMQKKKRS